MVDSIAIHEDDRGMRNLYPLCGGAPAAADIAEAAAERNREPSGFYSDVHIIAPPVQNYADCGLTLAEAERLLAPILPRVRRFQATSFAGMDDGERDPLGAYQENAWCFGLGNHCFIKLDDKGPLVKGIWFDLRTRDVNAVGRLRRAVEAINASVPSVIADYFLNFSGPVSDPAVLDRYFALLTDP